MILSLTIAWCLLSIPVGIVLGKCMRFGLSAPAVKSAAATEAGASGDEPGRGDVPHVPQQRQPLSAPAQLHDA